MKKRLLLLSSILCLTGSLVYAALSSPTVMVKADQATSPFTHGTTLNYSAGLYQDLGIYPAQAMSWVAPQVQVTAVAGGAATGVLTFTFGSSLDGLSYTTTAAQQFSFTLTLNGTTPVTVITNFPASLYMGKTAIRLLSVQNADAGQNPGVEVKVTQQQ